MLAWAGDGDGDGDGGGDTTICAVSTCARIQHQTFLRPYVCAHPTPNVRTSRALSNVRNLPFCRSIIPGVNNLVNTISAVTLTALRDTTSPKSGGKVGLGWGGVLGGS